MWIFLNPQLFLSGYSFLLLASGEFGNQSGILLNQPSRLEKNKSADNVWKSESGYFRTQYGGTTCAPSFCRVNPDTIGCMSTGEFHLTRCVWTEKCLNPERKSFGFTNIQIRADRALEYAQYYLFHFSITEGLHWYTFATKPIYIRLLTEREVKMINLKNETSKRMNFAQINSPGLEICAL